MTWKDADCWMKNVDEQKYLSQLNIPGTHDTMTGTADWHRRQVPFVATNDQPLDEQLKQGIRFIDIRCRRYQDHFTIHHEEIYLNCNFTQVLNHCYRFLADHVSETIIMHVKNEHTEEKYEDGRPARSFNEIFASYMDGKIDAGNGRTWKECFVLSDKVPTLKEARGKIVLVRRFSGFGSCMSGKPSDFGIDVSNWQDDASFEIKVPGATLFIQDKYEMKEKDESKWGYVEKALDSARTAGAKSGAWHINFTSGYKKFPPQFPSAVASEVNSLATAYLKRNPRTHVGTLVMDFPFSAGLFRSSAAWEDLVQLIATSNFRS